MITSLNYTSLSNNPAPDEKCNNNILSQDDPAALIRDDVINLGVFLRFVVFLECGEYESVGRCCCDDGIMPSVFIERGDGWREKSSTVNSKGFK